MALHAMDPDRAIQVVRRRAADLKNPPHTVEEILDMLALTVPTFAAAIRNGL